MRKLIPIVILILATSCTKVEKLNTITTGPEKGSLVIVGGGLNDTSIMNKFLDLAGGAENPVVVIVTAAEDESFNDPEFLSKTKTSFEKYRFKNVTVLHTRNPEVANTDSFFAPIKKASGLWFTGGRQWRLVDAYAKTKTYDEFINLLNRGGVIGGSSAGASIQGSFLVRGDTKTNIIMMGDHQEGFGFLKNCAIDQHLLPLNRQFDIFEILEAHPELLGVGIDENTAIVVQGNEFEVIGQSYVAVYDGTFFSEIHDKADWSKIRYKQKPLKKGERKFYFLRNGDRYNMKERKVIVTQ